MRDRRLIQTTRQLFLLLAGFAAVGVVLESGGLANWAVGLEIGPLRTLAVPATQALQSAVRPLGLGEVRDDTLENLARVGWSDDPALTAKVSRGEKSSVAVPTPMAKAEQPADARGPMGLNAPGHRIPAPGASTPLVEEVPVTVKLPPLSDEEERKPLVVALAGDSMMAVGLSAELRREAARDANLHFVRAFKSGTGLARPEVFNWMEQYPAMLGSEKPDVVIVAIGANDGQGFVVDGKVLKCGSKEWRAVYQQRLADYLNMVEGDGARVVWMALPPMRIPAYDAKIAMINRIAYTVVSQSPQATWWNPVRYIGDASGRFREFATLANGKTVRVRATDGIHLSDEGAGLVTPMLLKWLDPPTAMPQADTATVAKKMDHTERSARQPQGRGHSKGRPRPGGGL